MNRSVKTILSVVVAIALVLTGAAAAMLLKRPPAGEPQVTTAGTQNPGATTANVTAGTSGANPLDKVASAEFVTADLSQEERLKALKPGERLSDPEYKTVVNLYVANGPDKPKISEPLAPTGPAASPAGQPTAAATPAAKTALPQQSSTVSNGSPAIGGLHETAVSLSRYQPSMSELAAGALQNIDLSELEAPGFARFAGTTPTPTLAPNFANITFLTPSRGEQLTVGQSFTLSWRIDNAIPLTYKVFLSNDAGAHYQLIKDNLSFILDSTATPRTYTMTLPNRPGYNCRFRVEGYTGGQLYAYNNSQPFTLLAAATPTPSPTPKPSPALTPTPSPTPTLAPAPTPTLMPLQRPELRYARSDMAFVDRTDDPTRWMSLDIKTGSASKIVWQVSKVPFTGFSTVDTLNPDGLLASGSLIPNQREFAIDFGAIVSRVEQKPMSIPNEQVNHGSPFDLASRTILLNQDIYTLHVRAIALDSAGKVIGDPGIGSMVSFGTLQISPGSFYIPGSITGKIDVWIADFPSQLAGTYSYKPTEGVVAHPKNKEWYLKYPVVPQGTIDMAMQISTLPFDKNVIENPAGLVKQVDFVRGIYPAVNLTTPVPLAEFVPPALEMGTKTIRYYVRMVFFRQSATDPAVLEPTVSEVQTIYYNNLELMGQMSQLQPVDVFTVKSYVPFTQFLRYVPVQWEAPDWKEYFEVTRPIKAQEMCFKITNKKVGETLLPYQYYKFSGSGLWVYNTENPGMPLADYQARIDAWLPVGASFHLTINESSSIWGDMWNLAKSIYTSVQEAYNGIKSTIVNTIVNVLPVGDDVKSVLRAALNTALNAGLAALGIPPTLPNFAALASDGLDYCLEQAILEQCGIQGVVPEKVTDAVRSQLKGEIKKQLEEMEQKSKTNPLNVDFLKPASSKIYRPAYFEVLISNHGKQVSPSGTLNAGYVISGGFQMTFYKSVKLYVPPLDPGKNIVIKGFFKEYYQENSLTPYEDFYNYYYGKSNYTCTFKMSVKYDVPDVLKAAEAQGITKLPGVLPGARREYVYDHQPLYAYQYDGLACDYQLVEDKSVNVTDFFEK